MAVDTTQDQTMISMRDPNPDRYNNALMRPDMGLPTTPPSAIDPKLAADIFSAQQSAVETDKDYEKEKVANVMAVWENLYTRWLPFFRKAYKNYKYLRGDQISKKQRDELREAHRPESEMNFLLPLVVFLAGMIAKNKSRMQANPTKRGTEMKALLHTSMNEWAMNNCNGDYELASAAKDAAICGIGWTNNYWDVNADKWITKRSSVFNNMFDLDARAKEDQSDWRFHTFHDYYSAEEIISTYNLNDIQMEVEGQTISAAALLQKRAEDLEGKYRGAGKPKGFLDRVLAGVLDFFDPEGRKERYLQYGVDDYSDLRGGLYRVIEFHDKRTIIETVLINLLSGEKIEVPQVVMKDPDLYKRFVKEQHALWWEHNISRTEEWITAVCPKLLPERTLLEQKYPVTGKGFQFKPVFWYDFDPDNVESRGVLDNLMSVQDFFNQRMMSFLEWLLQMITPNWAVTKNSIGPEDKNSWQSAERGKIMEWDPNVAGAAQNPPKEIKPDASLGQALLNSANDVFALKDNLSGISPNSMGFKESSKESGVLYNRRVQAAMTMLEHPFAHIQFAQEQIFNFCDRNLQTFLKLPRAIRLFGQPPLGLEGVDMDPAQKNAYWVNLNMETVKGVLNDVSEGEYDFKADPTQLGQTAKQGIYMMNLEMFEKIAMADKDVALGILPLILESSDSPDAKEMAAIATKIRDRKMQAQDLDGQMAIIAKQQELAKRQQGLTSPQEVAQAPQDMPQNEPAALQGAPA